jgi:hypothetical protein
VECGESGGGIEIMTQQNATSTTVSPTCTFKQSKESKIKTRINGNLVSSNDYKRGKKEAPKGKGIRTVMRGGYMSIQRTIQAIAKIGQLPCVIE